MDGPPVFVRLISNHICKQGGKAAGKPSFTRAIIEQAAAGLDPEPFLEYVEDLALLPPQFGFFNTNCPNSTSRNPIARVGITI